MLNGESENESERVGETYVFGGMDWVGEVKIVDNGPLLHDLHLVVLQERGNFSAHYRAVGIEKNEGTIVMQIRVSKAHSDFEKGLSPLIPVRNLGGRL